MTPAGAVLTAYAAALRAYVTFPTETSLRDAYELGRRAMEGGSGILEMASMHGAAMNALVDGPEAITQLSPEHLRHCAAFLTEALSPFEMTHRGFREAHEILRLSEARYRSLVDKAPWGMGQCTDSGLLLHANPALCEMLGYANETDLVAASRRDGAVGRLPTDVRWVGEQSHEFEIVWPRADGTPVTLRMAGRRVGFDANGAVIEIMCEDVTERRALEARLREAQKMEAIGRLAGGVAHEINNFITGIMLYSHLASRTLAPRDPRRRHTDEIRLAAHRASILTDQLLTFSRRDAVTRRVVDLNEIVTTMLPLLQPLLGRDITLRIELHAGPCVIRADPAQLEQVLMNLTINACDAMSDGGALAIGTAIVASSDVGSQVALTVRDTGTGMDAETQRRAFEPFFTTKRSGRGTGLGLATCYAIATQSEGAITLASAPGAGTTFTLTLPEVAGQPEPLPPPESEGPVPGGTETILLADDDAGVRRAGEEILRDAGYTVLVAASGDEAIHVLEEAPAGTLDLVVTDVVMPGSDGWRVAECAAARHPAARVVIMSAHGRTILPDMAAALGDDKVLKKPFSPRALLVRVRAALEGVSGP